MLISVITYKGDVVEVKLAEGNILHLFKVEVERLLIRPGRVKNNEIHPHLAALLDSYRNICRVDTLEVQPESQLFAGTDYD